MQTLPHASKYLVNDNELMNMLQNIGKSSSVREEL